MHMQTNPWAGEKMVKTNCYECRNRHAIAGDSHSYCGKPDLEMTGNQQAIQRGYFNYPYNYDPVWMTKECSNFEPKNG